jgi:hypothetical protein
VGRTVRTKCIFKTTRCHSSPIRLCPHERCSVLVFVVPEKRLPPALGEFFPSSYQSVGPTKNCFLLANTVMHSRVKFTTSWCVKLRYLSCCWECKETLSAYAEWKVPARVSTIRRYLSTRTQILKYLHNKGMKSKSVGCHRTEEISCITEQVLV